MTVIQHDTKPPRAIDGASVPAWQAHSTPEPDMPPLPENEPVPPEAPQVDPDPSEVPVMDPVPVRDPMPHQVPVRV